MKTNTLKNRRIVVTRAVVQAGELNDSLKLHGAVPIAFPTIRMIPMDNTGDLDRAIRRIDDYSDIIFTSVNGVKYFWDRCVALGQDHSSLHNLRISAIGPATDRALKQRDLETDFVPDTYVAESIAEGLGSITGRRFLLPRAEIARKTLAEMLVAKGADVDEIPTYRTMRETPSREAWQDLRDGMDAVTFTSSSTVRHFLEILGDETHAILKNSVIACIGPITEQTARNLGLAVHVVASTFTIPGLVEALINHYQH